jgi:DNA-binding NarL/FixJ family response regulator
MERRPIRVGICDDHPLFRTGIRTLLAGAPPLVLVLEAQSLGELRQALAATSIDLLLLDINLPDGSGLDEVACCARTTRVVLISALVDSRSVRRALEQGAVGFLRKDASPDEVLRLIHRAAAGQTALSADIALSLADSMRVNENFLEFRGRLRTLTPRQREVLALLSEGRSNREIAKSLFVSEGTVKNHVSQILETLDVSDRTRLAILIARYGVVP